jgi:hypothetical protein
MNEARTSPPPPKVRNLLNYKNLVGAQLSLLSAMISLSLSSGCSLSHTQISTLMDCSDKEACVPCINYKW